MIFYHYTCRDNLPSIAREGLRRGEVPVAPDRILMRDVMWLTTNSDPSGHGLMSGEELPVRIKIAAGRQPDEKLYFADKRAVRFRVVIPSHDRQLVHWPKWARRAPIDPAFLAGMIEAGGGRAKAETWWMYRGVIPVERIEEALDLRAGGPLIGWPDVFRDAVLPPPG